MMMFILSRIRPNDIIRKFDHAKSAIGDVAIRIDDMAISAIDILLNELVKFRVIRALASP